MGTYLVNIFNWFINAVGVALQAVILLLPESPFQKIMIEMPDVIINVNWLFPIAEILSTLETWLAAIIVYYGYQVILRWVKAIE